MKFLLFLLITLGGAYLFGNYHDFRPNVMQPWLVQMNHDRENNPQALCDRLSLDSKVTIHDNIPRNKITLVEVDRDTACNYFLRSARLMEPFNPPQKNGFIKDVLSNVTINQENITKREGDASFKVVERRRIMRRSGIILSGDTYTKLNLRRKWLGGVEITAMELRRDYVILPE